MQISNVYNLLCHRPACAGLVMKFATLGVCLSFISCELGISYELTDILRISFYIHMNGN